MQFKFPPSTRSAALNTPSMFLILTFFCLIYERIQFISFKLLGLLRVQQVMLAYDQTQGRIQVLYCQSSISKQELLTLFDFQISVFPLRKFPYILFNIYFYNGNFSQLVPLNTPPVRLNYTYPSDIINKIYLMINKLLHGISG